MENSKKVGLKRLGSFIIDAIICELIYVVFTIINYNSKDLLLYAYIVSIMIIIVQPLELLIFRNSLGTLLCNFDIKNVDGSKPGRWKFLIQLLIYGAMIALSIFSGISFINIVMIISIIVCIASKNNRTLTDFILGLQGYKHSNICNNCGKELGDKQTFCDKCGSKVLDIPGKQENIALVLGILGIIMPLFSIIGFMLAKKSTSNSTVKKVALILNGIIIAIMIAAVAFFIVGIIYVLCSNLSGGSLAIVIPVIIFCVVGVVYILFKVYKGLFF